MLEVTFIHQYLDQVRNLLTADVSEEQLNFHASRDANWGTALVTFLPRNGQSSALAPTDVWERSQLRQI